MENDFVRLSWQSDSEFCTFFVIINGNTEYVENNTLSISLDDFTPCNLTEILVLPVGSTPNKFGGAVITYEKGNEDRFCYKGIGVHFQLVA